MSCDPRVVVALHAHPDDESLLTGGTLAGLARGGTRVVLVVATDGARGLTACDDDLAAQRDHELERAAATLGVARLVRLGYADSGDDGADPRGFCRVDPAVVAARVADVVTEEHAVLLLGYDRRGGYGHPDHRHVHAVATLVAARTGVRLLHATVDRTWLSRGLRVAAACGLRPAGAATTENLFSDRSEITHRVRSLRRSGVKRRALACHVSQTSGGASVRTVRLLAGLPQPMFALVAGTEWFVEPGITPARRPRPDVWSTATQVAA